MKANVTELLPVLEGTKQYIVPLFQRPYSWGKREWKILWEDIEELYEEDDSKSHFFGSIVTSQTNTVPEGITKYLLIDGQQRLTTIFILLCVLRDIAKEKSGNNAEQIQNLYLINQYKAGNDLCKLLPTQDDRSDYMLLIEGNGKLNNHLSSISNAYDYYSKKINTLRDFDLEKMLRILVKRLYVVSVVLEKDDNPYLIFEGLNAKGRPLTQGDLIRNYFLLKINTNEQENIFNRTWKPIEDRLKTDITNFFRHYLMRDRSDLRENEVYFELKELCENDSEADVIKKLELLEKYSRYYEQFIYPDTCTSILIRQKLKFLKVYDVSTCYPFLLSVFNEFDNGNLSEGEVYECLSIIENFIVRRDICGVPTRSLSKIFPTIFKQVGSVDNFCDKLKDVLSVKSYPNDGEFIEKLLVANMYGRNDRNNKTKYMLEQLESSFQHKEKVRLDGLTIEHILPQTLSDKWKDDLGNDWEESYQTYLHALGNLTITAYNSELSNADFNAKRILLGKSNLNLNHTFDTYNKWSYEEIDDRGKYLADIALSVWPSLRPGTFSGTRADGGVTGTLPSSVKILGVDYNVNKWIEVMRITLEVLFDLDPDRIDSALENFQPYVSMDKGKLTTAKQLKNGIYMERHLSAKSIYRFCQQITVFFEIPPDEYRVNFESKAHNING
jgi:uncharacterized protein with ParB-like and HNH nuclease domain